MDGKKGGFLDFLKRTKNEGLSNSQSVHEIEAQLGTLASLSDAVIVVYNYKSGQIEFSKGFNTVLGYPNTQDLTVEFLLGLIHPEDSPKAEFLAFQATKYQLSNEEKNPPFGTMTSINFRVKKFDGQYIMMINRSTGWNYKNGTSEATLNIMNDVSFIPEINQLRSTVTGNPKSILEHTKLVDSLYSNGDRAKHFTARELDVLKLIADGLPSKEIGEKLFISTHTVNNHRKNMLKRAGLKNSAELIRLGLKNGLI